MAFQNAITRRFTAEFSIRAYLVAHPERTYRQLERWVSDPNVHVRRLVSEGTRPRLPWAPRLTSYVRDPNPVLALLERLRDDPELYVRRSVANNLNDIGKDHPDLLIEVATRWNVGAGEERRHLIRHALRSLVKAGDARALALLGFGGSPQVKIEAPLLSPRRLSLGQTLAFGCDLISTSQRVQSLNADWIVHFVKRSGKTSPKVWKGRRLTLSPGERIRLASKIALVDLTTRKHHAGIHRIELLLNGVVFPIGEADVIAPRVTGQKDEGLRATVRQAAAPRRP